MLCGMISRVTKFLSTPSARRATVAGRPVETVVLEFLSTPSARRATILTCGAALTVQISIHALREEGDNNLHGAVRVVVEFLSTPSARRATSPCFPAILFVSISIHALREEGDRGRACCFQPVSSYFYPRPPRGGRLFPECTMQKLTEYFYPRPPRGGRQNLAALGACKVEFLSTPSARRATDDPGLVGVVGRISIHALREEGDSHPHTVSFYVQYFYPRPPRGGRPMTRGWLGS